MDVQNSKCNPPTSFFVTLSQSNTTNSNWENDSPPPPVGRSKTKDSLKTGLRLLFFMWVFFLAILMLLCSRYILTYGSVGWRINTWQDAAAYLTALSGPSWADSLPSAPQQSSCMTLAGGRGTQAALQGPGSSAAWKKIAVRNILSDLTFELLGVISLMRWSGFRELSFRSRPSNSTKTSPITSSRLNRSEQRTSKWRVRILNRRWWNISNGKYKYLKPIEVNSIESEVLITNRVHCISQDTGLHFVLFFWQNL